MNDKAQLAAMGEHLAEQPICLQKRVEQLEALLREARPYVKDCADWGRQHDVDLRDAIDEALDAAVATVSSDPTRDLVWRNTGYPNGLRRFMTQKQYDAQTPGVQKWYEPIRYEVPEGWQLVPVKLTPKMWDAMNAGYQSPACQWDAALAAAPKPGDVDA